MFIHMNRNTITHGP